MEGLANAAEHSDRHVPLKNYCMGLLLPGERKSIEAMAARLDPANVQPMRQCLHHLVAKAPWNDEALLEQVRQQVLPAMQKNGPVVAWIVDDTGFPKKGKHSVGVTRQYCGQVGKQENCRVAVSLSVSTWSSSLPIAYRLYLPKEWAEDTARRQKAEVPKEIEFHTKPEIALNQIRAMVEAKVARGVVLADAGYGINTEFREELTELKLQYVVGVQSSITVWEPGKQPLPAKPRGKMGRPPRLLQRSADNRPMMVKQLAMSLPSAAFREITWREVAVPLCRCSYPSRASRLLEGGTTRRRMAADRMAAGGSRTHQVLAVDDGWQHHAQSSGPNGQTPLDHRAGLSGTETGTGSGTL
jgi:SRSO17 transposase